MNPIAQLAKWFNKEPEQEPVSKCYAPMLLFINRYILDGAAMIIIHDHKYSLLPKERERLLGNQSFKLPDDFKYTDVMLVTSEPVNLSKIEIEFPIEHKVLKNGNACYEVIVSISDRGEKC